MDVELLKNTLCTIVNEKQGMKLMDLFRDVRFRELLTHDEHGPSSDFDLTSIIDDLVMERRIVEVEYVLPDGYTGTGKIKSFLLPGRSRAWVRFLTK